MADDPITSESSGVPASSKSEDQKLVRRSVGEGGSKISRLLAYRVLLGLAPAIFAADQLTKFWIARSLPFGTYGETGGAIPVVRGFFYLVHQGNTGAAWSMFTGRSVLLAALAAATLVAIYFWRHTLGLRSRAT